MSEQNTRYWDDLKRVPPEHLKGFQRAGGFKGTAVKPMWTIHKMTEVFGPCGLGWGMDMPQFQMVPAGDELLVYCTVGIWHGKDEITGHRVYGVGGDKVRVAQSSGLKNDDEAFKKAYTDALTNACKMLGAAADIHMGLWDGNKYTDDQPVERDVFGLAQGTKGASKAGSKPEYEKLVMGIRNAPTLKALADWLTKNQPDIDKQPPDWVDELRMEYVDRKNELNKLLAA